MFATRCGLNGLLVQMHSVLYEIFGKYLDDKEIMALTDHLMTTVGLQRGTVRIHLCS